MIDGRLWIVRWLRILCIQTVFKNRFQALVRTDIQQERSFGGSFHTCVRILAAKPKDAEAGTEALLRMAVAGQDSIDEMCC